MLSYVGLAGSVSRNTFHTPTTTPYQVLGMFGECYTQNEMQLQWELLFWRTWFDGYLNDSGRISEENVG
jgi:hypothetical protein